MNMPLEGGGEKTVFTKTRVSDLAVFSQSHPHAHKHCTPFWFSVACF